MPKLVESARFGNIWIQNYVNYVSQEKEVQFCAMEILLDDGTSFVAYRGTDDTIVGWKEDFALVMGEVTAQVAAVDYLNRVGGESERMLRVGGHSKGGNLAVYASANFWQLRLKSYASYQNIPSSGCYCCTMWNRWS